MKSKTLLVIIWLASLFLFGILSPVSANIIWSDDFSDDDYNDWTHVNPTTFGFDFVVSGGVVRSETDGNGDAYSWLTHPSAIEEGQWSFDFWQPNHGGEVSFIVMANGTLDALVGYGINIVCFDDYAPIVYLDKWDGTFWGGASHLDSYPHDTQISNTWVHFDVTCDASHVMNVYMDNKHILQYSSVAYNSSEIFIFGVGEYQVSNIVGFGMDNVVIDDIIVTPMTTTTTTTTKTITTATTTTTTTTTIYEVALELPLLIITGVAIVVLLVIVVEMRK